jgi:hypothetical protein
LIEPEISSMVSALRWIFRTLSEVGTGCDIFPPWIVVGCPLGRNGGFFLCPSRITQVRAVQLLVFDWAFVFTSFLSLSAALYLLLFIYGPLFMRFKGTCRSQKNAHGSRGDALLT